MVQSRLDENLLGGHVREDCLAARFLAVAEPIVAVFQRLGVTDPTRLTVLFQIVAVVWNLEVTPDAPELLAGIAYLKGQGADETIALLRERRRSLYPDDKRVVAEVIVEIHGDAGDFELHVAEIKLPGGRA